MSNIQHWLDAWKNGRTGFHLSEVNQFLKQFMPPAPHNNIRPHVLVPLCGKSLDIIWLASQGYNVIGIEASQIAVETFFEENELKPEITPLGEHTLFTSKNITVILGDFFTLNPKDVPACNTYYDRAALIALPESLRKPYAEQVQRLLTPGASGLLISMVYEHKKGTGPPFSLTRFDLKKLFLNANIKTLLIEPVIKMPNSLLNAGIHHATEYIHLIDLARPDKTTHA